MKTMSEVKAINAANGCCWFDPGTMRFWRSKIHGGIRRGKYFITSEDNFNRTARLFSIRSFDESAHIGTVGKFQGYRSLAEAVEALRWVA